MSSRDAKTQMQDISTELDQLKNTFERELKEAYERGWNDGVKVTPDHEDFHSHHQEPQWYGEDGEIVVISGRYSAEEAVQKIYALLSPDIEVTLEEVDENTHKEWVSLAPDGDENSYYADRHNEGVFEAWVWRA